jgi:hypothetical protein
MIDETFAFILGELNGFLTTRFATSEQCAVLSSILDLDGSVSPHIANKLILSLVNIERETVGSSSAAQARLEDGRLALANPSLNLNLYLLVSAYFGASNYAEALKFISSALAFFESNPVFTVQSAAAFPRGLERLTVEMVDLDFQELGNLWRSMGASYLPSVLYKVRMLTIQERWISEPEAVIPGTGRAI